MLVNRQIKMKYLWKTMEVFRTKKKLKGVFCCGKSSNPYLNSGILLIKQIKKFYMLSARCYFDQNRFGYLNKVKLQLAKRLFLFVPV